MLRRPTLTQRDGLFGTTRFILYGNRVRVIRQTPLERDDQYIPLEAVDPEPQVVRQPDRRMLGVAAALVALAAAAFAGWPAPVASPTAWALGLLLLLAGALLGARALPGRTWVLHGALQMAADLPDAGSFRHFEHQLVEATRARLSGTADSDSVSGGVSMASEIRRLHEHFRQGHLRPEVFARHKQRLIRSIRDYTP